MSKSLQAVYENGVLRPLEALALKEHQRVTVILSELPTDADEEDWLDLECVRLCAADADESISLETVRHALSKIPGALTADFVSERAER